MDAPLDRHGRRRARVTAYRRDAHDQVEEPANRRVLPHRPAVPWYLDHGAIAALYVRSIIVRRRTRESIVGE